jgi:hypothetical protein
MRSAKYHPNIINTREYTANKQLNIDKNHKTAKKRHIKINGTSKNETITAKL